MSEWKKCRLGDLTSLVCSGGTPRTTNSDYYEGGSIPWLNTKEVSFCRINSTEKCITESGLSSSSAKWVPANTVVVAMYGATAGQVAITRIPLTTNQACCNLVIDEGKANADFVYYSLVNSYRELSLLANGAAQQNLNAQVIKEFVVQLPDLPTQRCIAAVLGALDDKIENNRKICENLEAQAQALFKSWFVDFEPWGGKMPEEWKKGKLGDLAECNPFRRLPKGVDARCVEMADLVTNGAFPSGWSTKKYTGGMKFRNGDTIVARITPCFENGKAAFINFLEEDEVGFGSTEYVVISSCSAAPGGLFYSLVKSPDFITYAKSRMVGSSGRQRFNAEDVASFPLTIAPNNVYLELAPYYESIMEKIAQCGKESRALAEMRDALLPQLMSGRLRVDATACQGEIDVGKVEI